MSRTRAGEIAGQVGSALGPTQAKALLIPVRVLADQAFSRSAGAPLIGGNRVRLLKDAAENYPAWLAAIAAARRHVHFESYIIADDAEGRRFCDALIAKAQEGVTVRVIYDWMGGLGKAGASFWARLRDGGVEVRCFNPLRFDAPLAVLTRDHRKMLTVDGELAFISGLCVGREWSGIPEKQLEAWRDTGIELCGPAVADVERAFASVWAMTGAPLPEDDTSLPAPVPTGDMNVRIVASEPSTAGMLRLDQMLAALARKRIWLTDAYFAGTTAYIQSLRAASLEGVDVRLLLPGATDIPLLRPLTRSGYRSLLEASVRIFEWNGTMLHAKTSVIDGRWARVGSTNLNVASWLGNCELDAFIEDEGFAAEMEAQYLEDLANATEVVLGPKRKLRVPERPKDAPRVRLTSGGGGAGTVAAGAARFGRALGAVFVPQRQLEAVEARLTLAVALALALVATLLVLWPRVLTIPAAVVTGWVALTLVLRALRLTRLTVPQRGQASGGPAAAACDDGGGPRAATPDLAATSTHETMPAARGEGAQAPTAQADVTQPGAETGRDQG